MQLTNSFSVPAPLEESWRLLNDVERIAPCLPGATLDSIEGDTFTGRVKVKLGAIQLTYRGTGRFLERDGNGYRLVMEASGKEARGGGSASATVTASLSGNAQSTTVTVVTDLDVTGKPAQFGRGIMQDVGGRILGQFANRLAAEIQPAVETPADQTEAAAAQTQAVHREADAIDLLAIAGVPRSILPLAGAAGLILALLVVLGCRRR